ncbi:MAG: hypothetical protein HY716_04985 [Planctomycetes bacterium]|nr:hypothetical protein [Planctomycetota bacterium]
MDTFLAGEADRLRVIGGPIGCAETSGGRMHTASGRAVPCRPPKQDWVMTE